MFCTKCGTERLSEDRFCGDCGIKFANSDWKLPSEIEQANPDLRSPSEVEPANSDWKLPSEIEQANSDWKLPSELSKSSSISERKDQRGFSTKQFGVIFSIVIFIGVVSWSIVKNIGSQTPLQRIEVIENSLPATPTLDTANSSEDFLGVLNSLQFGRWVISQTNFGFSGALYVSNWPCNVYMASSYQDAVDYFNWKVNVQFYGGEWLKTDGRNWIVNDISSGGECIRYFANKYGGMIRQQQ